MALWTPSKVVLPPKKIRKIARMRGCLTGQKTRIFIPKSIFILGSPGSTAEGLPVELDLQGTIGEREEVKSPTISLNLSGTATLPTITAATTTLASVAARVRPTVTVEEHVPSRSQRWLKRPKQNEEVHRNAAQPKQ